MISVKLFITTFHLIYSKEWNFKVFHNKWYLKFCSDELALDDNANLGLHAEHVISENDDAVDFTWKCTTVQL